MSVDVQEELTSLLTGEVMTEIDKAVTDAKAGRLDKFELYTYLDRSRPYGQQRMWVRARVENGRPIEIECEDRDEAVQAMAHYEEWELWN